ncbi:Npun_F0813 family protein [Fischerella sp. PCC 9605]|uniref:Npun_F0813 family protein n=1 Tax=Fischerella sp. PCC 9605 TaxID=1173024 RepID=UPI000478D12B|nr:Npun_F0813 family protein [Fischerella sp. PCC 9605]
MFILKRQDVEISTIGHPKRDQQVPILHYQGQTFRLISVFKASQEEEAKALWRELTDNKGKACVLLEEPERFSVWGKIRLDQLSGDTGSHSKISIFTQASILLLQAVYMDIEDFLGARQAALFQKEIAEVLQQWQFPQVSSSEGVKFLLDIDPLTVPVPDWQEHHVITLLQDLHRLGKAYFGNTNFAHPVADKLQDMPQGERSLFISWLNQSPLSKLWH